jgi:hypothetical protein
MANLKIVKRLLIVSLFFCLALSCSHTGKTLEMTIIVDPHVTPMYEPPTEYEI